MVRTPLDYRWSSHRENAYGATPIWLSPLPEYSGLGGNDRQRMLAYRSLFRTNADRDELQMIRSCVQTGTPLGGDRFKAKIEKMLGRRVGQNRRGRPSKSSTNEL
jgi:putative transposase